MDGANPPARRLTAADFDQELLDLYDFYAHGKITKREFLDRAAKFAVGGMTADGLEAPGAGDAGKIAAA